MGLNDRDYMANNYRRNSHAAKCPKTGHWVGVENCSNCNYMGCSVRPPVNQAKDSVEYQAGKESKVEPKEPIAASQKTYKSRGTNLNNPSQNGC